MSGTINLPSSLGSTIRTQVIEYRADKVSGSATIPFNTPIADITKTFFIIDGGGYATEDTKGLSFVRPYITEVTTTSISLNGIKKYGEDYSTTISIQVIEIL